MFLKRCVRWVNSWAIMFLRFTVLQGRWLGDCSQQTKLLPTHQNSENFWNRTNVTMLNPLIFDLRTKLSKFYMYCAPVGKISCTSGQKVISTLVERLVHLQLNISCGSSGTAFKWWGWGIVEVKTDEGQGIREQWIPLRCRPVRCLWLSCETLQSTHFKLFRRAA